MTSKVFSIKIFTIIFGSIGITNLSIMVGVNIFLTGLGIMEILTIAVISIFLNIIYETTKEIHGLITNMEPPSSTDSKIK